MLIVCVESPFKPSEADVTRYAGRYTRAALLRQNIVYARMAVRNSLTRGETPLAAHLLYTQVESVDLELREAGKKAGIEAHHVCGLVALYADLEVSEDMQRASEHAELINVAQTRRLILSAGTKDPRELIAPLAEMDALTFPYLEELEGRRSEGRIKVGAKS